VTEFVLIAAVLLLIALAWLMPTLLRRRESGEGVRPGASNLAIIRDQFTELERDLASGTLAEPQYQQAREDLERRALEEARDAQPPSARQGTSARATALTLSLVIPLGAALLYVMLGSPQAVSPRATLANEHQVTPQEVEAMVARLAERLKTTPDDGKGWALLGRSYGVMQRYEDAARAYARAAALIKDDADLLADYADVLAMSQGQRIEGKPLEWVERALTLDPTQWKALSMAGSAAFERKDYEQAIAYWEQLTQRAEPNSELARSIASNIEEARQLAGIKILPTTEVKKPAPTVLASVQGSVSLSRAQAAKAAPSDTVFIFARAVEGPRLPLAILRREVKELPLTFSLDDTQAMSPAMKLSNFTQVVIGARVSKSGNATPQSGDLQGMSEPVKVGAKNVAIVIDSVIP
jgi:cytochrome c-type biogenesis protein CcmH